MEADGIEIGTQPAELGLAKAKKLDLARVSDQDIRGIQVLMRQTHTVGIVQRLQESLDQLDRLSIVQPSAQIVKLLLQGLALHVFADVIKVSVLFKHA